MLPRSLVDHYTATALHHHNQSHLHHQSHLSSLSGQLLPPTLPHHQTDTSRFIPTHPFFLQKSSGSASIPLQHFSQPPPHPSQLIQSNPYMIIGSSNNSKLLSSETGSLSPSSSTEGDNTNISTLIDTPRILQGNTQSTNISSPSSGDSDHLNQKPLSISQEDSKFGPTRASPTNKNKQKLSKSVS